jgi:hypothetical protein
MGCLDTLISVRSFGWVRVKKENIHRIHWTGRWKGTKAHNERKFWNWFQRDIFLRAIEERDKENGTDQNVCFHMVLTSGGRKELRVTSRLN